MSTGFYAVMGVLAGVLTWLAYEIRTTRKSLTARKNGKVPVSENYENKCFSLDRSKLIQHRPY